MFAQNLQGLVVMLFLAVGTTACDTPMQPTSAGFAVRRPGDGISVSGRALDYSANIGVPNVAVAVGNYDFSGRFVAQVSTVTDAAGSYTLSIAAGTYLTRVGDGFGSIEVIGMTRRSDFFVNVGTCVGRYGTITDMLSGRPVSGARVELIGITVSSDADGWYRVDLGCPANGIIGFNTTFMHVVHADYGDVSRVVGRGVSGVERFDVSLGRRSFR
jgi:hypothetical protein